MVESQFSILFGNDPQSYRQTLAAVVRAVRQELEVAVVTPEELDQCILRHGRLGLVICSRLTDAIKSTGADWILLYPDGDGRVEINCGGKHESYSVFDLDDLLTAIDAVGARFTGMTPGANDQSTAIMSL